MPKIFSLDVGEKRIGVASTDELAIIASPYGWIERKGGIEKLNKIFKDEGASKIVVGMPFLPSGGLGSQAKDVQEFVDELKKAIVLPIDFEDEVLTSVEAERRIRQMGQKNFEKGDIDAMAACIILESYLRKESYGS